MNILLVITVYVFNRLEVAGVVFSICVLPPGGSQ